MAYVCGAGMGTGRADPPTRTGRTRRMRLLHRAALPLGSAVLLLGGAAACGDDARQEPADDDTATTESPSGDHSGHDMEEHGH